MCVNAVCSMYTSKPRVAEESCHFTLQFGHEQTTLPTPSCNKQHFSVLFEKMLEKESTEVDKNKTFVSHCRSTHG